MERIQQQYINQNKNGEDMNTITERILFMFTSWFDILFDFADRMNHSHLASSFGDFFMPVIDLAYHLSD